MAYCRLNYLWQLVAGQDQWYWQVTIGNITIQRTIEYSAQFDVFWYKQTDFRCQEKNLYISITFAYEAEGIG